MKNNTQYQLNLTSSRQNPQIAADLTYYIKISRKLAICLTYVNLSREKPYFGTGPYN